MTVSFHALNTMTVLNISVISFGCKVYTPTQTTYFKR
jgi:hypothetical protein